MECTCRIGPVSGDDDIVSMFSGKGIPGTTQREGPSMKEPAFCPHCGLTLQMRDVSGTQRLACPESPDNYTFWDNPIPVVAAVIELDGKVILARNRGWPEKVFGLVTGFLERGETPEQGVLREVREELGLDGSVRDFLGLFPFFRMNQLIIAYDVAASGAVALGEEIVEVKAVPPDKVRPWDFGTGPAVREWLDRRGIGK